MCQKFQNHAVHYLCISSTSCMVSRAPKTIRTVEMNEIYRKFLQYDVPAITERWRIFSPDCIPRIKEDTSRRSWPTLEFPRLTQCVHFRVRCPPLQEHRNNLVRILTEPKRFSCQLGRRGECFQALHLSMVSDPDARLGCWREYHYATHATWKKFLEKLAIRPNVKENMTTYLSWTTFVVYVPTLLFYPNSAGIIHFLLLNGVSMVTAQRFFASVVLGILQSSQVRRSVSRSYTEICVFVAVQQ